MKHCVDGDVFDVKVDDDDEWNLISRASTSSLLSNIS